VLDLEVVSEVVTSEDVGGEGVGVGVGVVVAEVGGGVVGAPEAKGNESAPYKKKEKKEV
jgi:hypothetical protein